MKPIAPSPKTPIDLFRALHVLSRGNSKDLEDYQTSFLCWMKEAHRYSFLGSPGEPRLVKGPPDNPEILSGHRFDSGAAKGYFKNFIEDWPRSASVGSLSYILELPQPIDIGLIRNPGVLSSGRFPGPLLISIKDCEVHLIQSLCDGALHSWGRPFLQDAPGRMEPFPKDAFIGPPLLDWIASSLGARSHARWDGEAIFPHPPLYTDVRLDLEQIEKLRSRLVRQRKREFLEGFPPTARKAAEASWRVTADRRTIVAGPSKKKQDLFLVAEQKFCEIYARSGMPIANVRVSKDNAFKHLNALFYLLSRNQFDLIWDTHAPQAWREPGRPKAA